jgi:hypothetical protein
MAHGRALLFSSMAFLTLAGSVGHLQVHPNSPGVFENLSQLNRRVPCDVSFILQNLRESGLAGSGIAFASALAHQAQRFQRRLKAKRKG